MSRWSAAAALWIGAAGCVEVREYTPPARLFEGAVIERVAEEQRPFVGLTLEETLGSLDEMDFAVGLEVVAVDPGSPAEAIGIEVGDRVIEATGAELSTVDQWQAVLDAAQIGEPLALLIERDAGLVEASLTVAKVGGEELPDPVRFAEREKLRVELETVAEGGATYPRVVRLLDGSPLAGRIEVGEDITSIDGQPAAGARLLIDRVSGAEYGRVVAFGVRGPTGERTEEVALWSPPRVWTRLAVPILFDYQHDPDARTTEFELIDLWLFSLYDYRRELQSRRHRLLYFFEFSTGAGELTELPSGGDS